MFTDARGIAGDAELSAELCIIGAGAAGITIARALAGTAVRVCLLESGDLRFRWDTQALYRGANVGLPYFDLDVCQARYFGGNTNAWGGWCRWLDAIDMAPRPWIDASGWPIGPDALQPYAAPAIALCELPSCDFDARSWSARLDHKRARLLPFDPAKLQPAVYQFSPPTRFGRVYRAAIGAARNVNCLLNATALKLCAGADGRALAHVDAGTLAGNRFRVSARLFVLAAGGIENARLLLLSNDGASNGIGNAHDLVGRYFMEHPHTKRALVATPRRPPVALYGLRLHSRGVSVRLDLPPSVQEREGLLHYSANIHPVYRGHDTRAWIALRKLVLSLSPARLGDPYVRFPPYGRKGLSLAQAGDIMRQPGQAAIAAMLQFFLPDRFITGYVLESKSEQAPNRDSRVTLAGERDAFGLNRAQLDWRMSPIDRRTVVRGEEIVDAELRRLGLGRLAPLPPEQELAWPDNLEGGWHQMGTTRMAADPRHGVVDGDGLVHGVANLFIAGSSVFPTGGAAPPTLTIVALALRLADRLRQRLAPESIRIIRAPCPVGLAHPREPAHVPFAGT
jgi:choline dehydrogenase-like flavoprotein